MSTDVPVFVLDSFALLAYLEGETGMGQVRAILQKAKDRKCRVITSIINLGEMAYITEREQGISKAQAALRLIEQLPIEVQSASDEAVFRAAHIKANYPVAYADAFAISLAQALEGTVLTSDPEFKSVEKIIQLEWLAK